MFLATGLVTTFSVTFQVPSAAHFIETKPIAILIAPRITFPKVLIGLPIFELDIVSSIMPSTLFIVASTLVLALSKKFFCSLYSLSSSTIGSDA